jgi:hypothetical protein
LNLGDVITLNVGNIGLVVHDQQTGVDHERDAD